VIQSVGTSSCSSAEVLEYWRRGVMECWSTGVARFVAAAFFSLLITDLLVTDYFGSHGIYPRTNGVTSLPITFHFSLFTSPLTSPFY
jgi:hypothetical protein